MNTIGLLTVRNEIDVINEFLDHIEQYFTDVVVMDDSTDGTFDALMEWHCKRRMIKHLCKFDDIYGPNGRRVDGKKQHLLEVIDRMYGDNVWITILNDDAFFGADPRETAAAAAAEGATLVRWPTYNFYPHDADEPLYIKDKAAWLAAPVRQRLRWYDSHQYEENLQFFYQRGQAYNPEEHARVIPHGLPRRIASIRPVLLHYPIRSPEQLAARCADRQATGFRVPEYYAPFIEAGGFVRPGVNIYPRMKNIDTEPING